MPKNTLKFILALFCIVALTFTCYAATLENLSYGYYGDYEVTVQFSENSPYTPDQQKIIADTLVYHIPYHQESANRGLLCTLLGHNIVSDTVAVITHKYFDTAPRCLRRTMKVETCSRCDYYQESQIAVDAIYCCP